MKLYQSSELESLSPSEIGQLVLETFVQDDSLLMLAEETSSESSAYVLFQGYAGKTAVKCFVFSRAMDQDGWADVKRASQWTRCYVFYPSLVSGLETIVLQAFQGNVSCPSMYQYWIGERKGERVAAMRELETAGAAPRTRVVTPKKAATTTLEGPLPVTSSTGYSYHKEARLSREDISELTDLGVMIRQHQMTQTT